jgi:hypothetical protein
VAIVGAVKVKPSAGGRDGPPFNSSPVFLSLLRSFIFAVIWAQMTRMVFPLLVRASQFPSSFKVELVLGGDHQGLHGVVNGAVAERFFLVVHVVAKLGALGGLISLEQVADKLLVVSPRAINVCYQPGWPCRYRG